MGKSTNFLCAMFNAWERFMEYTESVPKKSAADQVAPFQHLLPSGHEFSYSKRMNLAQFNSMIYLFFKIFHSPESCELIKAVIGDGVPIKTMMNHCSVATWGCDEIYPDRNMGVFCVNLSETIPLDQNQHYPLVICYITIENCPFSSWIYSLNMVDLSIAFCMFTRPATETPALVTSA